MTYCQHQEALCDFEKQRDSKEMTVGSMKWKSHTGILFHKIHSVEPYLW